MLAVNDLLVAYSKRDIVDIPSFELQPGAVTALLGPNGAGKSTFIRCLAGALKPKKGTVQIDGGDIHRMSARERACKLAFVGQENNEQFAFTVRELVSLGAEAAPHSVKSAHRRADDALQCLDLADLADRNLLRLSGGERQRAAIARALAQQTPYLLLDEPTAHLDLRHQDALMNALRAEAQTRNAAVLIVLHDLNLAAAFADRLVLLANGEIAGDGPPRDVITEETIRNIYRTSNVYVSDTLTHFRVL